MKLELIKKYTPDNINGFLSCVVPGKETAIVLVTEKESDTPTLLYLGLDDISYLPLDYLNTSLKGENHPVLFSLNGGFGIIKTPDELFYHASIDSKPVKIAINNQKLFKQVLPPRIRFGYANPVNNAHILPVCFEHTVFDGSPRYFAFLNINVEKQKSKWESWGNLDPKQMPAYDVHSDEKPPKIDSIILKDNEVYIFTSGARTTSVYKWGMDYYGIIRANTKGETTEILFNSGDLREIDGKKRGVNGKFSACGQYAILTPIFQSDEWKGKQKLFAITTRELIDIEFPRGLGKYPQIIQCFGSYYWIFLPEKKHFAICREI